MKDTRDYILKEAYKLFLNNSYEAVSVSMICEAIGFTKGALYHHFTSKEELFHAVIDKYFRIPNLAIEADKATLQEYIQVTLTHTQKTLRNIFGHDDKVVPVNYFSLITDIFRHYQGFFDTISAIMEEDAAKLETILRNAIRRREIRDDINVQVVAKQFISLAISLTGYFIRISSVETAMKMMEDQFNQLYELLKK